MRRAIVLCTLLLAACSSNRLSPYKIDVQQGNVVTQEAISKLKPGMTKSQVRFVLGTPLLSDAFHADRWDYVYRYEKAGAVSEQRRIAVIFKGEQLLRIEGDVTPAQPGSKASAGGEPGRPGGAAPSDTAVPAGSEGQTKKEKGFFGKLLEKIGF